MSHMVVCPTAISGGVAISDVAGFHSLRQMGSQYIYLSIIDNNTT